MMRFKDSYDPSVPFRCVQLVTSSKVKSGRPWDPAFRAYTAFRPVTAKNLTDARQLYRNSHITAAQLKLAALPNFNTRGSSRGDPYTVGSHHA